MPVLLHQLQDRFQDWIVALDIETCSFVSLFFWLHQCLSKWLPCRSLSRISGVSSHFAAKFSSEYLPVLGLGVPGSSSSPKFSRLIPDPELAEPVEDLGMSQPIYCCGSLCAKWLHAGQADRATEPCRVSPCRLSASTE